MKTRPVLGLLLGIALASAFDLEPRVHQFQLANGMQWIVVERHDAPTFAGLIMFRAGSIDEERGYTGLAHLFEHMAFKGTETIGTANYRAEAGVLRRYFAVGDSLTIARTEGGDSATIRRLADELTVLEQADEQYIRRNEFSRIYVEHGAMSLNASTSNDFTRYFVALPVTDLELYCRIEADRIADPVFREFYKERSVVADERRLGESNPWGVFYSELIASAYDAHPYRNPIVGWASDIPRLTVARAQLFHDRYYGPGNAVGLLVGDLDPTATEALVRRYFGRIPARAVPPRAYTAEPVQRGEKRVQVNFDARPMMAIAFHVPGPTDPDTYPLDVLSSVLGEGVTSRLHRRLVIERELARSVYVFTEPGERFTNLLVIGAVPRHPHTCAELEAAILADVETIKNELVAPRELERVKNRVAASHLWGLTSNLGMAFRLSSAQLVHGDWRQAVRYQDRIAAVTAEQVRDAARRYFTADNRTVATLVSTTPAAGDRAAKEPR